MARSDFLNEVISERTRRNPRFSQLLADAVGRRRLARRLAIFRVKRGLTQTVVAARMKTSSSVVSKLEGGADVRISTLQRYCSAIGHRLKL